MPDSNGKFKGISLSGKAGDQLPMVQSCPVRGKPCPCLPGGTSHMHCLAEAGEFTTKET
jgi:hypothetical protein